MSHPITTVVHFSHLSFLAGSVSSARVLLDETIVVQGTQQRRRAGIYHRVIEGAAVSAEGPDWRRQRCSGAEFQDTDNPFHAGELIAPHPCPFLSDVHEDRVSSCTCCAVCQSRCVREI